jgi:HK97 family phage portal protein
MAFWSGWFGGDKRADSDHGLRVAATGEGAVITTPEELAAWLQNGSESGSGVRVTVESAMRVAAVYACVRIISGAIATLPLHVKQRVDDRTRKDASDTPIGKVLRKRPNRWQTPSQFRRMLQAHLLLRGRAYAMIVRSPVSKEVQQLIPLHPDQVRTTQNDDLSLSHVYTRRDGRQVNLRQDEVFYLVGLTFDGVNGVSVLTYARESIGESLAMSEHGATMFKNGARVSGTLSHPKKLDKSGRDNLRASLDEFRGGGERDGKVMILEEGMAFTSIAMTSVDAQWVESRKFSRTDIAMFFGVPPHMIGDTDKTTSWGSGIEQQSIGFVTYTLEDHLTMWEEVIDRDLLPQNSDLFALFNRSALVKGDIKARWEAYAKGRRMKVLSANDVRGLEDMNPIEGGDVYENPEITVRVERDEDEPAQSA